MNYRNVTIFFAFICLSLVLPLRGNAMMVESFDEQLSIIREGKSPEPLISGARYRVAVFSFEDPNATGLGDSIANLIAHEILMNTRVSSLGVILFKEGLHPTTGSRISYFDKVDLVTAAQGVSLAIWGVISQRGGQLVVDTYIQIPRNAIDTHFTRRLRLPSSMGAKQLVARLKPDRFRVQHYEQTLTSNHKIVAGAKILSELREEPDLHAPVIALIPKSEVYRVVDRQGDWVQLTLQTGTTGWMPVRGHCRDDCRALLDAAVFAGEMLRFTESENIPTVMSSLTTEALAVAEQLGALKRLSEFSSLQTLQTAIDLANRWTGPERLTGSDPATQIDRGSGTPPGGAAFANIKAIANLAAALKAEASSNASDTWVPPKPFVQSIAFELAAASLEDPRNTDVLENLVVLFSYTGDEVRARLASELANVATDP